MDSLWVLVGMEMRVPTKKMHDHGDRSIDVSTTARRSSVVHVVDSR
jgi:hypothetical protein